MRLPAVPDAAPVGFPDDGELAALRAWMEGVPTRVAVEKYLSARLTSGRSSRSIVGDIRRQLAAFARSRGRHELVEFFICAPAERRKLAKATAGVIEVLRRLPPAGPVITDDVEKWLSVRACRVLRAYGVKTLADLTVRVPRRRRWWTAIDGLGARSAKSIEAFFAMHPALTQRAQALVIVKTTDAAPWESIVVPADLDGSRGRFRGERRTCSLEADDDYTAVQAWLHLHEASATQRAYKKEAERLMLWSILHAGKALSSLTTEDAVAYRAFLRRPAPRDRWVGPARPRSSVEWRPFQGSLSATSIAYALSVLNALFRWLLEKGYVVTNPFSGVKARGADKGASAVNERVFSSEEWQRIRSVADAIENVRGWTAQAAQRLRFVLDFWFATGLRPQEMVDAKLGHVHRDALGDDWLIVLGKGAKKGRVAIPTTALGALERHLAQRGVPTTRARWAPDTPLVGSVDGAPITRARIWAIVKRFFARAANELESDAPALADQLRRASPHWMRHTHASHALRHGADLKTVQDNLRHASIATTTIYLHGDQARRARQMREAFAPGRGSAMQLGSVSDLHEDGMGGEGQRENARGDVATR